MKRPAKRRPVKPKLIVDPGSTHDGSLQKAKELVRIAAGCGADAIKFQLLTPDQELNGNIGMDWYWLPKLKSLGEHLEIEVFASAFDEDGIIHLHRTGIKSIKFSHRTAEKLNHSIPSFSEHIALFKTVYSSTGVMHETFLKAINLYCIPEYPVKYTIDFEGIFPRFQGFSSHCLGIKQDIKAVKAGAKYIEKHFQGDWDSQTPDGNFALRPKQLMQLAKAIK